MLPDNNHENSETFCVNANPAMAAKEKYWCYIPEMAVMPISNGPPTHRTFFMISVSGLLPHSWKRFWFLRFHWLSFVFLHISQNHLTDSGLHSCSGSAGASTQELPWTETSHWRIPLLKRPLPKMKTFRFCFALFLVRLNPKTGVQ